MQSIIVHIMNEEPILCEVDKLPKPSDQVLVIHNMRRRDGTDVHYIDDEVMTIMVPWHRINFVQVLPAGDLDEVIGFVRE
ncbi:MAG: hypothetical protein R6X32_06655 [Chloroflexota bacterium]|jgi:hypothetical protein